MKRLTALALSLLAACLPSLADNTTQTVEQVTGAVTLDKDVDYHISSATPFTATGSINLTDTAHAVIIFDALKPSLALNQLAYISINGAQAVNGKNCQVKIYNRGAIIMPYGANFKPLTVYTGANFTGESCNDFNTNSSGGFMQTLTDAQFNNRIMSFRLKRGYMVTFSLKDGGRGYSRCFVADKADLEVNLPALMQKRISSYRLFKWNDVSKAGLANNTGFEANDALNTQWCYSFGVGGDTGIDRECVPHHIYEDWPNAAACGSVNYTTSSPNMKTNNEPRNTGDDHPQTLDQILDNWESLMRTGQRLCTPSSWDGSYSFNQQFLDSIDARGWRCDILDIHAYWATSSFYQLQSLHNNARRPIWVTEWCWGASWNKNGAFASNVTEEQNANNVMNICNLMNNWNYVERYAYWNSERDPSRLYKNDTLTECGRRYAAMQPGLAYNSSVATYVPSNPRTYAPTDLALTFRPDKNTALLTWNEKNGELNDSMWIERKVGTGKLAEFEPYRTIALGDEAASYSFTDTVTTAGYYTYRVAIRTFDGRLLYTNEVTNSIAGTTSVGKDDQRGALQYGTLTTGTSEEGYLYFDNKFDAQPAIVFGSLSDQNTSMMPMERVSNVYSVREADGSRKYSYFRYSIYPFNQTKSTSSKTDFYNGYTDYTSYIVAKTGTGQVGTLNYEAGVSANCAANDTVDITFEQTFAEAPVVLATPIMAISTTERYPVATRVFDVTPTGCRVALQRQQALNDNNSVKRTIKFSYVAIEKGQTQDQAGKLITVKDTTISFISKATRTDLSFGEKLTDAAFLVQMQTVNNPSLTVLRTRPTGLYASTDSTGTKIRLQVDDTSTATAPSRNEPWTERLGWIAISTDTKYVDTAIKGIADHAATGQRRSVYTINGVATGKDLDQLPAGIYIVRENGTTRKVMKK